MVKTPDFQINRSLGEGKAIARLPMLGLDAGNALSEQFPLSSVDEYVAAIRSNIGATAHALESSVVEAAKALGATPPQAMAYAKLSFMPDPANYGLMQWPGIQPESLRKITQENIAPQLIIRSRVSDIRRYAGLSIHPWDPGWEVVLRDARGTPSEEDRRDMRAAESFVANCSRENTYVDPRDRDQHQITAFETFLTGAVNDTFTFDGWAVWTDMDLKGRVRAFANLPAGAIRLALPNKGYRGDPARYAALVDETGTPVASFTRQEMTWRVRNVRTDPAVIAYGWAEPEICVRLIQAFQAAIDLNADTFCYSEDTEVLTRDGWRLFSDVDIDADEFATLNMTNGAFEYQKATDKTWVDYDGEMYALQSRCVDLLVSPNHRVVTQYRGGPLTEKRAKYTVSRAEDLYEQMQKFKPNSRKNYGLPSISTWGGVEIQEKTFSWNPPQYKGTDATERRISGDDYCAFMGMYLSEGSAARHPGDAEGVKNKINIHQHETSKGFAPFQQLLTRVLGHTPPYYTTRFSFGWRGLAQHVQQFGDSCYTKRIPPEILNATPRQQAIFWKYYVLGDGSVSAAGQEHIATTSRTMADNLQELAQKMGFAATICTVNAEKYEAYINGRKVKSKAIRYDVYLKRSDMQSFNMAKGSYRGKIGCVTVPNGTLYVRRGGKAAWCGNTRSAIPNGILKLKGDFWQQEQIDALMREWTNMKRGVSKLWGLPVVSVPEEGDIEVMPFMDLKGQDVRYKDHMNMMMGCACVVYQYPVRRLGMFVSGHGKDNQPVPDQSVEQQGVDDPGMPALLQFIEGTMNEYLIWNNWPKLAFRFRNKDPKNDARSYEAKKNARTWGEARAAADEPKLVDLAPDWLKPLAEIMDMCPENPSMVSAFQTMAVTMLESKLGISDAKDKDAPGAPFPAKKDPAKSQEHGHRAGVRRPSAQEAARTSEA